MPSMANITVKAANGTTDVVYTAKSPSAGNSVPAIWRDESLGGSPNLMPQLQLSFRDDTRTGGKKGRGTFWYPMTYTDSTSGLKKVAAVAKYDFNIDLPQGLTVVAAGEAAAQFGNLLASTLVKASNADGYAPT